MKELKNIFDINNAYKRIKKNKDVFTLNQYILSEQEKTYINHIYPDAEKTSIESAPVVNAQEIVVVALKTSITTAISESVSGTSSATW